MNKVTVSDINFRGRKVLARFDFNVPLDSEQNITDDRRIKSALPTIQKILSDGGKLIACSHLGRPKGKPVPEMSLAPVVKRLTELLGKQVTFAEDCIGPEASNLVDKLEDGDCLLLENLRFHEEEEKNDPIFAEKLASLADIYVNDAFGTAHRAHASTVGVCAFFNQSVAGYLMEKELKYLGQAVSNPDRPFAAVLGGAKITGKIDVIEELLNKVDILVIGGGMVFTFARAVGYPIGKSLLEEDKIDLAAQIIKKAQQAGVELVFPSDVLVASNLGDNVEVSTCEIDKIPDDKMGLDIGPETIKLFNETLKKAKTIIWNGPMGVFENPLFEKGTTEMAKVLAECTSNGAITVVGGGDSAAAVEKTGLADKLTHISTGGGASLEFLEGRTLPGVAALTDNSEMVTAR